MNSSWFSKVHFSGSVISKRLVWSLLIVIGQIIPDPLASFPWGLIVLQVHILIFHRSPQPLRKDIVQGTTFAILTSLHCMGFQQSLKQRTREMAALFAVDNHRRS